MIPDIMAIGMIGSATNYTLQQCMLVQKSNIVKS